MRLLCLAACAMLLPLPLMAADPVNLEGTWKLAAPQTAFKPDGGAIPFTAQGRKRYQANTRLKAAGKFDDFDYYTARCTTPGTPRSALTPDRFRIWPRSGLVMFQFEWNRTTRQIDTGVSKQLEQSRVKPGHYLDTSEVGQPAPIAKGHWEGDTLVAQSEGFIDNTLIDDLVPHGYDMKVTERFRLRDNDTLENRITIEDPEYFTRPWQTVVVYKRQPDAPFREDVCLARLRR
jgi:hypothetical protein